MKTLLMFLGFLILNSSIIAWGNVKGSTPKAMEDPPIIAVQAEEIENYEPADSLFVTQTHPRPAVCLKKVGTYQIFNSCAKYVAAFIKCGEASTFQPHQYFTWIRAAGTYTVPLTCDNFEWYEPGTHFRYQ